MAKKPQLSTVQKAVIRSCTPNKSSLPILNKVSCNRAWDSVAGNNLDVEFNIRSKGYPSIYRYNDNCFLLDKKTALDCIGQEISLAGNNSVKIGARSIPFTSFEEYPQLPKTELTDVFSMNWNTCRESLRWMVGAISTDLTGPALCALHVKYKNNASGVRFESTDGRRAYRDCIPALYSSTPVDSDWEFLIPRDLVATLGKLPACDAATVQFAIGEDHGRVVVNYGEFVADFLYRQVEGPFPDVDQVWPKSFNIKRGFDVEWLDNALAEVLPVASIVTRQINIETTETKTIVSTKSDGGKAKVEALRVYPSKCFKIGFNGNYLRLILSGTDLDNVGYHMNRPDEATEWKLSETRKALLMPLRLID